MTDFIDDLTVALATCPKRYLDQARSRNPAEADQGRAAIARHCAERMPKWQGKPPAPPHSAGR